MRQDWNWNGAVHYTLVQWLVGSFVMALSYPVSQAMTYVIFSKVIPNDRQVIRPHSPHCPKRVKGTLMGWLTAGGAIARMLGPPWATWSYTAFDKRTYIVFFSQA